MSEVSGTFGMAGGQAIDLAVQGQRPDIGEVEDKANAAGPESVARWDAFNAHYAMAREMRELRKARNLTQKQLAAASGIDQAEISRIERGQTNPTTSTLAALLGPLGARLGVVAVKSRDRAKI